MNLWINEVSILPGSLPTTFAGYPLVQDDMWYRVFLNEHDVVSFASPVGMMKICVDAILPDATGLMVNAATSALLARDGTEIEPRLGGVG